MNGKYWDKAWSLVSSCTRVSPGCDNCWSLAMENRFHKGEEGKIVVHPERIDMPLKRKKPTIYSVWNDLFHDDVPDEFIQKACETMWSIRAHTFLVLTKRPDRMAAFFQKRHGYFSYVDHVWLGTTAENQEQADIRIPTLRRIPGNRFISVEPCLEQIDLCLSPGYETSVEYAHRGIHWAIIGGETGHSARPCHTDWVRSVRDQCREAGVPFWFKQFGTYKGPGDWDIPPGRLLDGREWSEVPW